MRWRVGAGNGNGIMRVLWAQFHAHHGNNVGRQPRGANVLLLLLLLLLLLKLEVVKVAQLKHGIVR